jgi:hypothetical protein
VATTTTTTNTGRPPAAPPRRLPLTPGTAGGRPAPLPLALPPGLPAALLAVPPKALLAAPLAALPAVLPRALLRESSIDAQVKPEGRWRHATALSISSASCAPSEVYANTQQELDYGYNCHNDLQARDRHVLLHYYRVEGKGMPYPRLGYVVTHLESLEACGSLTTLRQVLHYRGLDYRQARAREDHQEGAPRQA